MRLITLNELNYYSNYKEFIKKNIIKFLVKMLYKCADIVVGNSKNYLIIWKNTLIGKFIRFITHVLM